MCIDEDLEQFATEYANRPAFASARNPIFLHAYKF